MLIRWGVLGITALVASVSALELTMQAAAFVVGATGRNSVSQWVGGATRVLTLGDSNTYGLFLPPEQSFPAQFETLWNSEIESPRVEVINLGYPGTNSSVLLNNLPKLLDTFRPDVVLVMVGVNDFWTDVVSRDDVSQSTFDRAAIWLRQHSRVYKLASMIRRSFYDPAKLDLGERSALAPEAIDAKFTDAITKELANIEGHSPAAVRYGDRTFDFGFTRGTGNRGSVELLEENLRAIVAEIEREGGRPVLLTYPAPRAGHYDVANRSTRRVARLAGVPLVDIAKAVSAHCPDSTRCPDLFFPDNHAREPGYAIAARTLVAELRTSGLVGEAD